jgi:ABC-type polysaccharide/polyol phosphate transport system ATPase subunit
VSNPPVVVIEGVSKTFRLYKERNESLKVALMRGRRAKYEEFWALRDVSFEIPQGKTFGIMGVNGSGKSTLLKCIANILQPDTGRILTAGKLAALLELGSGFHPELSGRENIYLNGSILGLSKKQLDAKLEEIVDFAGVERFIDQPVKNYSSGMYVRLGFSVAINVDPDVLLVDEVLAVGDQAFQDKCATKFADYKRAGKTVIIVSHAMGQMRQMCDEVAWLEEGRLVDLGSPGKIIDQYIDESHEVEVLADGEGRRWGSGEARLVQVSLVDRAGLPTTLVHTEDEVTIRLEFNAQEPIRTPVFGLTLWTREGVEVWSQHTGDAQVEIDRIVGRGVVELTIPKLMLLPGAYDLSASIVDDSLTHVYDFHRHCSPFHVEAGPRRDSGGLMSVGGVWSVPKPVTDDIQIGA